MEEDKQSEDELLGLGDCKTTSCKDDQLGESVDAIEAELLLMSSSADTESKSVLVKAGKEGIDSSNEVKHSGDALEKKGATNSKIKNYNSKIDENPALISDDDSLLDSSLVENEILDSPVEILDKSDSIDVPLDSKKRKHKSENQENSDSLILVESVEQSETNRKAQKSDSVLEVIDDEDLLPASCSDVKKRKLDISGDSQSAVEIIDQSTVEIIDDEDDDDLEIIDDSESDVEFDNSNNSFSEGKICIFWSNGSLFVWNAEDAQMIREECRIVGKLTGCLPRHPRQNNHLGLPLQLMPEEARLLVEIDAAVVVEEKEVSEKAWKSRERGFTSVREDNVRLQIKMYKESRKEEVKQKMGEIIAGKKAKRQKLQNKCGGSDIEGKTEEETTEVREVSDLDTSEDGKGGEEADSGEKSDIVDKSDDSTKEMKDSHVTDVDDPDDVDNLTVEDVMKDDTETSEKHTLVQIFTENPWKRKFRPATQFHYPATEREELRYAVFKDLWKKGYYLTSGVKFGGDFLVYPGDPARFHSHYIAVCLDHKREVSALDVVSMGRLASNVRKTTLMCSLSDRRKKVIYISLQWTGFS